MSQEQGPVQLRSEEGELRWVDTLEEAMALAIADKRWWKISFSLLNGERVRLIRERPDGCWIYQPIFDSTTPMPG